MEQTPLILMKTEVSSKGINERFVVTSFRGKALTLYDFYVGRGEVENQMIKELKLDLNATASVVTGLLPTSSGFCSMDLRTRSSTVCVARSTAPNGRQRASIPSG